MDAPEQAYEVSSKWSAGNCCSSIGNARLAAAFSERLHHLSSHVGSQRSSQGLIGLFGAPCPDAYESPTATIWRSVRAGPGGRQLATTRHVSHKARDARRLDKRSGPAA